MYEVYNYIKDHGIGLSTNYAYLGVKGTCKNSTVNRVNVKVTGITYVANNTEAIKQALGKLYSFIILKINEKKSTFCKFLQIVFSTLTIVSTNNIFIG